MREKSREQLECGVTGGMIFVGWLFGYEEQLVAALSVLRGRCHEALENPALASRWYQQALRTDPFCYDVRLFFGSTHSSFAVNYYRVRWWYLLFGRHWTDWRAITC
jgi:hypothetical protein